MKKLIVYCGAFCIALSSVVAQQKVVHFRKLQEFLPTLTVAGFERKRPSGSTQTVMGMSTSEAKVRYVKHASPSEAEEMMEDAAATIEVTISDISLIPFAAMAFAFQQEFDNETEDGYERSVTVKKKYKGKESASTEGYKQCELEFSVANRFLIKLQASNTDDVKLLHQLAESIDLEKLEKLTPEE